MFNLSSFNMKGGDPMKGIINGIFNTTFINIDSIRTFNELQGLKNNTYSNVGANLQKTKY